MKNYNINMPWDGVVINKKSFLYVSVYSDRVLQLFLSILVPQLQVLVNNGFTQNIQCSLFDY